MSHESWVPGVGARGSDGNIIACFSQRRRNRHWLEEIGREVIQGSCVVVSGVCQDGIPCIICGDQLAVINVRAVANGESIIRSAGLGSILATSIILISAKVHQGRVMAEVMCMREVQVIMFSHVLEIGSCVVDHITWSDGSGQKLLGQRERKHLNFGRLWLARRHNAMIEYICIAQSP